MYTSSFSPQLIVSNQEINLRDELFLVQIRTFLYSAVPNNWATGTSNFPESGTQKNGARFVVSKKRPCNHFLSSSVYWYPLWEAQLVQKLVYIVETSSPLLPHLILNPESQ